MQYWKADIVYNLLTLGMTGICKQKFLRGNVAMALALFSATMLCFPHSLKG